MKFCFEIEGKFKSEDLWAEVKDKSVNVIDLDGHVYIHGSLPAKSLVQLLEKCCKYGKLQGSLHQ